MMKGKKYGRVDGRGFTLPELLIAIGVLAVMIALAIPTFRSIESGSQGARCANNLRSLAAAAVMFSNDSNGALPNQTFNRQEGGVCQYLNVAIDYIGRTAMTCPSLNRKYPPAENAYHHRTTSINLVVTFDYKKGVKYRSKIASPSTIMLFLDGMRNEGASTVDQNHFHFGALNDPAQFFKFTFPHSGLCQAVFLDGHVESVTREQLEDTGTKDNLWYGR